MGVIQVLNSIARPTINALVNFKKLWIIVWLVNKWGLLGKQSIIVNCLVGQLTLALIS